MPQERRSYSKSFKAQVIAECAQPETSIGSDAIHPQNSIAIALVSPSTACLLMQ